MGPKRKSEQGRREPSKRIRSKSTKDASKGGYGSKHDDISKLPGQVATKDRVPEKGQLVYWKAMPGICKGEMVEYLQSQKQVAGKPVKASKDDPRLVVKSHGPSGKLATHKLDKIYFES